MSATTATKDGPARVRLTFDIDEKVRREVKHEAIRRGVTVREYVTDLIMRETDKNQK